MNGSMSGLYSRFLRDESGATAIEYGLIAGGIAVAIMTTIWELSDVVETALYDVVAAAVSP